METRRADGWTYYFLPLGSLSDPQRRACSTFIGDWNAEHNPPLMPARVAPIPAQPGGYNLAVLNTEEGPAAAGLQQALAAGPSPTIV